MLNCAVLFICFGMTGRSLLGRLALSEPQGNPYWSRPGRLFHAESAFRLYLRFSTMRNNVAIGLGSPTSADTLVPSLAQRSCC